MPENYQYRLLRTGDELEAFRSSWEALWKGDIHATPFQSPQWLLPWWHQFGTLDLRAVVVSCDDRPLALLPFYILRDVATNKRRLLLLGVGTTDYLDGIFAPECNTKHVHAALDLLRREGGWDVLDADQLRGQSLLYRTLRSTGEPEIQSFAAEPCSRMRAHPVAELPVKIRRNAMYYRNRAARMGRLEFVLADDQSWPRFFDDLIRLHTTRWQSRGEPGVLADRRVLEWHREAIPLLQQHGMLRLGSLHLNGETLGVAYSLVDPVTRPFRNQYVYLIAHSMERSKLRPGTLLLAELIERAAKEGIDMIDMLRGEEEYKKLWHVEPVPTYGFIVQSSIGEWKLSA
jgi:CelD/BcsL family acetyltransferase involved in cellulose biosynthesis